MNIAIFGAGSTGCYIGGLCALAGLNTTLICRERIKQNILDNGGIRLTDYEGQDLRIRPNAMITEVGETSFDLVIITLKCHQLESASAELEKLSDQGAHLLFMQNGIGSLKTLAFTLHGRDYSQGITPFNVLSKDRATFHRGTEGELIFEENPLTKELAQALSNIGFECELHKDMRSPIYGKLLLNLNNAINAIADIPLKTELEDRRYRKVLAKAMTEWMEICSAQEVKMTQYTAVPAAIVPAILKLPNWLFKLVANKMISIDPEARSSMWEDVQAGRKTEIEFLNGAVAEMGQQLNIATPVNEGIAQLIKRMESGAEFQNEALLDLA